MRCRTQKTTNDSIALIGELSGFSSRATLARLFRNAYGMSHSEYRYKNGALPPHFVARPYGTLDLFKKFNALIAR